MVAPLILKVVAFSLAKKVVVFLVAKLYGFPKLYRRASEFNHYINRDNPKRREKFQNRLQFLFRLPSHIYESVQRWRGVQPPQGPPSSAAGHSHGTTSSHSQHKQVREIHTRSSTSRVISSLNVPNPASSLSGFGSISQSIRSHLLGLGESRASRTRAFSVSRILPFGVSSLISPKVESEGLQACSTHFSATGSIDSHISQTKTSLQNSQSGPIWIAPDSNLSLLKESSITSASETMVSTIDESRNSSASCVGLSLIL
ncbi:hypothetical protein M758_12G039500 [Ceratodon purpureus]|nr:hypothetical protein M758_12G039500 [Ceratodon purpureus]